MEPQGGQDAGAEVGEAGERALGTELAWLAPCDIHQNMQKIEISSGMWGNGIVEPVRCGRAAKRCESEIKAITSPQDRPSHPHSLHIWPR